MKYQITIFYNREEAIEIFNEKKYIYELLCDTCNKPFYLATDRHYKTVIRLNCPHCKINHAFFLEDLQNNQIYKWQFII